MKVEEQLSFLEDIGENESFEQRIKNVDKAPIVAQGIEILQVNTGKLCNLTCKHCHVQAGPNRTEVMSKEIMEKCLEVFALKEITTLDITGGSPEMNPHLEWFLKESSKLRKKVIVRTNCVILKDEKFKKFIDIYSENKVELVTSVPDYQGERTDRQRGKGVFGDIINVIKILNCKGYGIDDTGLVLNIVHNPVGAFIPGMQCALEFEYRKQMEEKYNIRFNNLFCLTNIPVGRYLEFLVKSGNYLDYMTELSNAFNPSTVDNVMCRNTLSVGWDGILYDCDFNQMLELPVNNGKPNNIKEFDPEVLRKREIVIANHCYGCVAGSGSSCQGAIS